MEFLLKVVERSRNSSKSVFLHVFFQVREFAPEK